jgi:hypothetical protein
LPQRIVLHIGKHLPTRWPEWILASMLTSWGGILLRPENTFGSSPSYEGLARIASEQTWGWFCLGAGVIRLIALTVNGSWVPTTYHLRSLTAFLSCFFWLQITIGFMASGNASTGLAVYPWLLIADIACVYLSARDYRISRVSEGHV